MPLHTRCTRCRCRRGVRSIASDSTSSTRSAPSSAGLSRMSWSPRISAVCTGGIRRGRRGGSRPAGARRLTAGRPTQERVHKSREGPLGGRVTLCGHVLATTDHPASAHDPRHGRRTGRATGQRPRRPDPPASASVARTRSATTTRSSDDVGPREDEHAVPGRLEGAPARTIAVEHRACRAAGGCRLRTVRLEAVELDDHPFGHPQRIDLGPAGGGLHARVGRRQREPMIQAQHEVLGLQPAAHDRATPTKELHGPPELAEARAAGVPLDGGPQPVDVEPSLPVGAHQREQHLGRADDRPEVDQRALERRGRHAVDDRHVLGIQARRAVRTHTGPRPPTSPSRQPQVDRTVRRTGHAEDPRGPAVARARAWPGRDQGGLQRDASGIVHAPGPRCVEAAARDARARRRRGVGARRSASHRRGAGPRGRRPPRRRTENVGTARHERRHTLHARERRRVPEHRKGAHRSDSHRGDTGRAASAARPRETRSARGGRLLAILPTKAPEQRAEVQRGSDGRGDQGARGAVPKHARVTSAPRSQAPTAAATNAGREKRSPAGASTATTTAATSTPPPIASSSA